MSDQATLPTFDPLSAGLYRSMVGADGVIAHGAWQRACAEGLLVGTCRACGDYLVPYRPELRGTRTDYAAQCRGCGKEILAPNGAVLRRSSRKNERGSAT